MVASIPLSLSNARIRSIVYKSRPSDGCAFVKNCDKGGRSARATTMSCWSRRPRDPDTDDGRTVTISRRRPSRFGARRRLGVQIGEQELQGIERHPEPHRPEGCLAFDEPRREQP